MPANPMVSVWPVNIMTWNPAGSPNYTGAEAQRGSGN